MPIQAEARLPVLFPVRQALDDQVLTALTGEPEYLHSLLFGYVSFCLYIFFSAVYINWSSPPTCCLLLLVYHMSLCCMDDLLFWHSTPLFSYFACLLAELAHAVSCLLSDALPSISKASQ